MMSGTRTCDPYTCRPWRSELATLGWLSRPSPWSDRTTNRVSAGLRPAESTVRATNRPTSRDALRTARRYGPSGSSTNRPRVSSGSLTACSWTSMMVTIAKNGFPRGRRAIISAARSNKSAARGRSASPHTEAPERSGIHCHKTSLSTYSSKPWENPKTRLRWGFAVSP